jgi:hypothetical protein
VHMAEPARVAWQQLAPDAQDALRWGTAAEGENRLGTRGILIGLLRAGGAGIECQQLLDHFAVEASRLFDALRRVREETTIDPDVAEPLLLDTLPAMTPNGVEVLGRAADLARNRPVAAQHLLGGILHVPSGRAYEALAQVLDPLAELSSVAKLYDEFLQRAGSVAWPDLLRRAFPPAHTREEPGDHDLSPSVRRSLLAMPTEFTASALVAELSSTHPEYAGGQARELELDAAAGRARTAPEWLGEVRALFPTAPVMLHGRLLIAALAHLDETLAGTLRETRFLELLESEIREPLPWQPTPVPEIRLSPAAREVLDGARELLERDEQTTPRAAILMAAFRHAAVSSQPTVAHALLLELPEASDGHQVA